MKTEKQKQKILEFFKSNPSLTIDGINKEAGLPIKKLGKILRGISNFSQEDLIKIEPVLIKYGMNGTLINEAKIISIANHKGGVGKTTTTLGFAEVLAIKGYKVLIIDFDPQGNLTQILNKQDEPIMVSNAILSEINIPIIEVQNNIWLSPSDIGLAEIEIELLSQIGSEMRLKAKLKSVSKQFDYILIDCPPSLSTLTVSALNASNTVIIAMQPEASSMKGLNTLIDRIIQVQKLLNSGLKIDGIVFTLVRKVTVHDVIKNEVKLIYGQRIHVFDSEIKLNAEIPKTQISQSLLKNYNKNSDSYIMYENFVNEYLNLI